jgi:hypothetical protein
MISLNSTGNFNPGGQMKNSKTIGILALSILVGVMVQAAPKASAPNLAILAADLKWNNDLGITTALAWGTLKGPHGLFMKFPPGFASPAHIHTDEYHGVVVTGTIQNPMGDATSSADLTPGSYWNVPAKAKHITKCVSKTECIIYTHGQSAFDFIPTK